MGGKISHWIKEYTEKDKLDKELYLEKNPGGTWKQATWYSFEYFPPKTSAGE